MVLSVRRARVLGFAASCAGVLAGGATGAQAAGPPPSAASPSAIAGGLIDKGEAAQGAAGAPSSPAQTQTPRAKHPSGGLVFVINRIDFDRSRFLSAAELQALATPLLGRKIDLGDLQHLAEQVNALYAKRGILTGRAFVPPQRISGGVVRVALVEAKLGSLRFQRGRYTHGDYAAATIRPKAGEVLDIGSLQRQINRFNRNNDSQAQASFSPGTAPGSTDVVIALTDPPRNLVQLFVDNNGYASTGRLEGGVLLRRNHLLMDGDRATLYVVGSGGSITGNASYSIPTGLLDGKAGLSYAHSDIRVVSGSTSALGVHGTSDTGSFSFAVPVVSRDRWTLSMLAVASVIHSLDEVSGRPIDDTSIAKQSLGVSASRWLGRFARISGDLQGSRASVGYSVGQGPGQFWEASADFDLATVPWHGASLHVSGVGQYVDHKDVPGTQLFQIGGFGSVRGYEPGVATGHAGYAVQSELHLDLKPWRKWLDPYGFADTGEVWSGGRRHARADGAGVGLVVNPFKHLTLQASYAFALDHLSATQYGDRLDLKGIISF